MLRLLKRTYLIQILLLFAVSGIVTGITIYILYKIHLKEVEHELYFDLETQISLMETIAKYDLRYSQHAVPGLDARGVTLMKINNAYNMLKYRREHFDMVLAEERGDGEIDFITVLAGGNPSIYRTQYGSKVAIPMQRALQTKKKGLIEAKDYRNIDVLAAYGYIAPLHLGIVVKKDAQEVRKPYVIAIGAIIGVLAALMAMASIFLWRINRPIVQQVEENDAMYHRLFDNNPAPLILLKGDFGQITAANKAATALFSYEESTLCGHHFSELMEEETFNQILHECISRINSDGNCTRRCNLLNEVRTPFPVTLFASSVSVGGVASILLTVIDRREEVELERQRQKEQAFLHQQSRLASMGEMIGAIAHQWRQPLNAVGVLIQSITYWAQHTPHDVEKIENQSHQAMEQLSYMSHTIDDFRNFFKVDPYPITVDINSVAIKTVQLMFEQLHFNEIKLSVQTEQGRKDITREDLNDLEFLHTTAEKVVGYPNELMQALVNIFQNSRDAIFERRKYEDNEVEGEISIRCYENENGVSIVICDNGCGIPENAMEHLFEPYFTTKAEGTGIGLYVVYRIIHERFGGKIDFENKGDGTCVTVYLPYR